MYVEVDIFFFLIFRLNVSLIAKSFYQRTKISDWPKLKAFTDDKKNVIEKLKFDY